MSGRLYANIYAGFILLKKCAQVLKIEFAMILKIEFAFVWLLMFSDGK